MRNQDTYYFLSNIWSFLSSSISVFAQRDIDTVKLNNIF